VKVLGVLLVDLKCFILANLFGSLNDVLSRVHAKEFSAKAEARMQVLLVLMVGNYF
jgi:hypothetical protein